MADVDSFRVTWAVPLDLTEREGLSLYGWLRVHGVDPVGTDDLRVAEHPLLGQVIIYAALRDARGRSVMSFGHGSPRKLSRRVYLQPLGMPPPPSLRVRGEARARELGLRLPVAALLSGRAS